MREFEKILNMIDEETEVFALIEVEGNSMILPTRYISVTYRGKDAITNAYTSAITAIDAMYKVRATFTTEVDAVKYLIKVNNTSTKEITKSIIELYKYKYPELFI